MRGTGRFFVRSKDYFRMPFGFNAGKVDAVAGNTDLADLFLAKILKALRVFFGVHSDCYLHIKRQHGDIAQKSIISTNFKPKSKLTFFADRFAMKKEITYEHRNRKRNQN